MKKYEQLSEIIRISQGGKPVITSTLITGIKDSGIPCVDHQKTRPVVK
jgi:hypothetical protein